MLITYGQFQLAQAVRSSAHLLYPRTVLQKNVKMPKNSVIHWLSSNDSDKYPHRDLPYLNGIPKDKRVPVFHVTDLLQKTEVQLILDRYLAKNIRTWQRSNMRVFREFALLESPNPDQLTNGIINYNLLKGLYKYKASLTANYSRQQDLMTTYWSTVALAIEKNPQANHFASIAIPKAIPSRSIIERIITFAPAQYSRVVDTPELNDLIQVYKYLNPLTRKDSTMAAITEEAAQYLTLEFTYSGYSLFCKLSDLLSIHKDSKLPDKIKLPTDRVNQVFLLMMLKTQGVIEAKLQNSDKALADEDTADASDSSQTFNGTVLGNQPGDSDNSLSQNTPEQDQTNSNTETLLLQQVVGKSPSHKLSAHGKLPVINPDDTFDASFDISGLAKTLDTDLGELEGATDDLFVKAVAKAVEMPKQTEAEDPEEIQELNIHEVDYSQENVHKLLKDPSTQERFEAYIQEAKGFNAISTAEVRTLRKTFEKRQQLKSPYGDLQIDQYKQVTSEDLTLPDTRIPINNNLVQDHLKTEVLFASDKKYIQGPMKKHLVGCVMALEKNDIIVKDYEVTEVTSSIGKYEIHKLTLKPLRGKESSVYFRLPVINDEGEYLAGGIRYRMRRQRGPSVLSKISATRVGIASNYNKLFVYRTERKAFDPYANIIEQIKTDYLDNKGNITKIAPGNRYNNNLKLPNIYAALSKDFNDITTPTHRFFFNHSEISKHITEDVVKALEKEDLVFIGHDSKQHILVMDKSEQIFDYSNNKAPVGEIIDLLQLNKEKIPQAFSAIKILGDAIPLGVMFGYYMGLKDLVAVTRSQMEVFPPRKQVTRPPNGVVLTFSDARVVITCPNQTAELLFAGFLFYKNFTKTHTLESFYSKNVYLDLLESRDAGLMHLKEMDTLRDNFIDPVTEDALKATGEPTEFLPLLLRANQMLDDFHHLDINDPTNARIRGYDRVPGLVYRALSESVRTFRMKGGKGKIELDPYKVWKYVTQDTTVKVTEDNNPITDVKEVESFTFSGADGLSRTATPEKMRKFHIKDPGLVSEATVDSTDVALNAYLTPYAKIKSLLGDVDMESTAHEDHPEMIFSTSVQLCPMIEMDDPKRMMSLIAVYSDQTRSFASRDA